MVLNKMLDVNEEFTDQVEKNKQDSSNHRLTRTNRRFTNFNLKANEPIRILLYKSILPKMQLSFIRNCINSKMISKFCEMIKNKDN